MPEDLHKGFEMTLRCQRIGEYMLNCSSHADSCQVLFFFLGASLLSPKVY